MRWIIAQERGTQGADLVPQPVESWQDLDRELTVAAGRGEHVEVGSHRAETAPRFTIDSGNGARQATAENDAPQVGGKRQAEAFRFAVDLLALRGADPDGGQQELAAGGKPSVAMTKGAGARRREGA